MPKGKMKTSIVVLAFFIGVLLQILCPSEYYSIDTTAPTLDFVKISEYGTGDFDIDYDEDFIFDCADDFSWPRRAIVIRSRI
jgi:hypothetical protein